MSGVLRLIAGGLLALICCYVGLLVKRRYATRVRFYKALNEYVFFMSSELATNKTPIPNIAEKFLRGRKGEFESVLDLSVQALKSGEELKCADMTFLKPAERQEVMDFLCGQGKSLLSEQMSVVRRAEETFANKQKKCEEESKKFGGMYFKLFVLLALAIMLILA